MPLGRSVAPALLVLAAILGPAGPAGAVSEAAAPSLIIPPGARACAMGQSYVAIADDATAMHWNPAALAWQDGIHVSLVPRNRLIPALAPDVYYWFGGATFQRPNGVTLGLSFTYLDYGKWRATSPEGEDLGEYGSHEWAGAISLAQALSKHVALGGSMKVVRESLVPEELNDLEKGVGTSWAVDVGLLLRTSPDYVRLGLLIQNLGPPLRFTDANQKAPLPRNLKLGYAWSLPLGEVLGLPPLGEMLDLPRGVWEDDLITITLTAEINKSLIGITDRSFREFWARDRMANGGWELKVLGLISCRGGFIDDPTGDIEGSTRGWGISTPTNRVFRFSLDHARVPKARGIGFEEKWSAQVVLGQRTFR